MTKQMTVREVLDKLGEIPRDIPITGLSADSDSYRGYYERLAIEPGLGAEAGELFDHLARKLGTYMTGYKGGEFEIHGDTLVHVARWGDTGKMLVDIVYNPDAPGAAAITKQETW